MRVTAKLHRLGWPKGVEIKASILHRVQHDMAISEELRRNVNGDEIIKSILRSVKNSCSPRIDYIAVNKGGFTSSTFRKAPYGVAYNFLAGQLLSPLILHFNDCVLTVDKRNKETHSQKHFSAYIETKVLGDAHNCGKDVNLEILHEESHNNRGLQAVDYFAWSVNRKLQSKDSQFFDIFKDLVVIAEEWYK